VEYKLKQTVVAEQFDGKELLGSMTVQEYKDPMGYGHKGPGVYFYPTFIAMEKGDWLVNLGGVEVPIKDRVFQRLFEGLIDV